MLKRMLDIGVSVIALILLSPIMFGCALAIALTMGRPVIFSQKRPGLNAEVFSLYKFRSMKEAYDDHGEVLPTAQRITALGRFIRKTSIDELPSLFNVLKGDLSIVGPRPLKIEYLELYSTEQARRHNARPGITGWAQVNGRNTLGWADRFKLDVWYVDNQSFWLDIKIILLTVVKVFKQDGVEHESDEVSSRFTGKTDD